jgi:nucleotide-binding universal stress UspA family protein
MLEIRRMLVPTDLSRCAEAAFEVGFSLARELSAEVLLLHVVDFPEYGHFDPAAWLEQVRHLLDQAEEALAGIEQAARAHTQLPVASLAVEGRAAEEIVRVAQKDACELIVMSTHGRSGVRHALVGSVAEEVVRTAPCPVMTVRCPQGG